MRNSGSTNISGYGAIISYNYELSYDEQIKNLKDTIYDNERVCVDIEKELDELLIVKTYICESEPSVQRLDAMSFMKALPLGIKLNVYYKICEILKKDLESLINIDEEKYNEDRDNRKKNSNALFKDGKLINYNWDNHDQYKVEFN